MPLIVVEGVDGSGKTTLIQSFRQVAKRHCLILSRSGPPKVQSDLLEPLYAISNLGKSQIPLIVDRHPLISEPIYGPICRGKSMIESVFDEGHAHLYVSTLANRIIYCRPEMDTIMKSARREKQMEGVIDNLWALYQKYDQVMTNLSRLGTLVIPYDWTLDQSIDLNNLFLGVSA